MDVSVVIPTYNEKKTIEKTVNSLLHQNYRKDFEIIIVDSNSSDGTDRIIKEFSKRSKKIKFISIKDRNIAKARNIGVKNSKGKIIAFIDAGRIAPENWLVKIVKCFKENNIGGIGGKFKVLNKKNLNMFEKFTALDRIYRPDSKRKYVDVVCTGNAAFKKNVIEKVGGFDEFFLKRGENPDFCYRVAKNNRILFRPDIFVYFNDSYNLKKFLKEHFLNGFYHFFLYLKHKNKILGDDYKRSSFILQSFILLTGMLSMLINLYFVLPFILIFFILNINFLHFVAQKERNFLATSFLLQILRTIMWIIGAGFGVIKLLKIRFNDYESNISDNSFK